MKILTLRVERIFPPGVWPPSKAALPGRLASALTWIMVREPRDAPFDGAVRVDKWMVTIQTSPDRPDVPRQKIKLKIANVPAYSRDILPLRINYSVLEGRNQPLVAVEPRDEILADKLIALPASIFRMIGLPHRGSGIGIFGISRGYLVRERRWIPNWSERKSRIMD